MGALRTVSTLWCVACGLVVPAILLGVVLARSLGVLDLDPLVDRLQPGRGTVDAAPAGIVPVEAEDGPISSEAASWRRQLEALDDRVARESMAVTEREEVLRAREGAHDAVAAALAELLSDLFEVPVSVASVREEQESWRARLAARGRSEEDRPRLLKMLQSVETESLAEILSTSDASNGIDEFTVTQLLDELPPSRAAEVLTELGRLDPALAARIVGRLQQRTAPPPLSSVDEGDSSP